MSRAAGQDRSPTIDRKSLSLTAREDPWVVFYGLLPFVWPHDRPDLRRRVVLAFAVLLLAKVVTVCIPIFYKKAADMLAGEGGTSTVFGMDPVAIGVGGLIFAYGFGRVLMMVLNQIRDLFFTKVGQHAVRTLNNRTFRHLHQLGMRFHMERRTGGLSRVLERAARAIELIIRMGILNLVPTFLELVLVCALLFYYFDIMYVLIVVVTVSAFMWYTLAASEWRLAIRREMNDSDTDANTKAIDSLLNFETVKYFGNEEMEAKRFDASLARYEKAAVKTYYSLGFLNSGQALIFTTGMTLAMYLAARGVASGVYTVGDFVMINALMIQLLMPLNFMGTIYREIRQGIVDIETMFAVTGQKPEIVDAPDAPELVVSKGAIRFDNVSFAYDPERVILHGLTLDVPAGNMVAIVGPSGAGKSTISRILFRFYDIQSGAVTIDGQDVRDVTQDSLRRAIGVVPQDTVLFNDTIAYNIRYGRPDATEAEVRKATEMAQIADFIETLPHGYDTMVGERGLKLSGGEKQRVAIARTILKNPPILIFDEATSALDSHTEREVQDAMDRVSKDRTTVVIAHRLSTIVHADTILVLDKGKVAEQGTHAELLQKDGLYASLWTRQRQADKAREELALALEEAERAGVIEARETHEKLLSSEQE